MGYYRQIGDTMRPPFDLSVSRRGFLQAAAVPALPARARTDAPDPGAALQLDARWIWYPERRTLPSTFVFFRKAFDLAAPPAGKAPGWVTASSRYKLFVNGRFLGRGPAPSDPRTYDIDPVDLAPHLHAGRNVIAGLVCYFGGGDGTSVPVTPVGGGANPGFLFQADIPDQSGQSLHLASDASWKCLRAPCWPAGQYQRWFLRALQEEFDARLYPAGWDRPEFDDRSWRGVRVSPLPPGRPNLVELPKEGWHPEWRLTPRSIPPMQEEPVAPARICSAGWVRWNVPPEEYFQSFTDDAFLETPTDGVFLARPSGSLFPFRLAQAPGQSAIVTFEFREEVVGHPFVRLRAPSGTVVEILYVEAQDPSKLLLRTAPSFGQWVRLTAGEGETAFETFDYDALRFLQLAVRNAAGPVEILDAGVRRRTYPYPHRPDLATSDATLNRALACGLNTHLNTSQDTIVDNVTRERQQYAGDLDHAKLASYYAFGEYAQPARMLRTFSQGQNDEGWFMDSWPAWDRCERLWQKHLHLTVWGPLIDHALELVIATAKYHLFTGDRKLIAELYPRFLNFDRFLESHLGSDGLLPVTGYVWNSVWLDHRGWKAERDKTAALNIYYAGYLKEGLARLAEWMGDGRRAEAARRRAAQTIARVRAAYWSPRHRLFLDNLPHASADGELRAHDRTCSMALLYGAVPDGEEGPTLDLLAALPTRSSGPIFHLEKPRLEMGFSYPLNACWRLWALSRFSRSDAVVRDLRERWGSMRSLILNNTFSEDWEPKYSDTGNVWCQNGPVVIYTLYGDILGIRPTAPGFLEFDVRPQPGGLEWIEGTVHSPAGPIHLRCESRGPRLLLKLSSPPGLRPSIVLPAPARLQNAPAGAAVEPGPAPNTRRWRFPAPAAPQSWELVSES
jgi:hypothetical protein